MRTRYYAFVDPASGGGRDSMTLSISHVEGEKLVLDLVREENPPFRPSEVVAEFCRILRAYKCFSVTGDRFASGFAAEAFQKGGITYEVCVRSKSELFADLLPLINSGVCELLDNDRLSNQLEALERRTSRGGRDQIAAPPAGFDDLANAVAGALTLPQKGSELCLFPPLDAPASSQEQTQMEQEEEKARQIRREWAEQARDGSDFFSQSVSLKKKNDF